MKNVFVVLLVVFGITSFNVAAAKRNNRETVVFSVPMDCQGCVDKIEHNIAFEKGVTALDIDFERQQVSVTYNVTKTTPELLSEAFRKIGKDCRIISSTVTDETEKPEGE